MSLTVYTLQLGVLMTNCYLVVEDDSRKTLVIDPGAEPEVILSFVTEHGLQVEKILLTHGHGDHIGAVAPLKNAWHVPVKIHEEDAGMLTCSNKNLSAFLGVDITAPDADKFLADGDTVSFGSTDVTVLHTPGHTRGGVSFHIPQDGRPHLLFSGDTLFDHEVGRCDLPGGSLDVLRNSVREKMYVLPDDTLVYPGHGPATTIGIEKRENPYVRTDA
jgi:glyoxylase-like metal-dependent hydrolase (beta-lactamase superfamily II)